jgi:hypothetical protein
MKMRVMAFYDDFLWSAGNEQAERMVKMVRWCLPALGFALNAKCDFTPGTCKPFLGCIVDTANNTISISEARIRRAKRALKEAEGKETIPLKLLETLAGQITSMRQGIIPAQLYARALNATVARAREQGTAHVTLESAAAKEMEYWRTNLETKNGRPIVAPAATVVLCVDASETAIGAHTLDGTRTLSVALPVELIGTSSTQREMKGVREMMRHWAGDYKDRVVEVRMDSQAAVANLINGGGPVEALTDEAKRIFAITEFNSIQLIPRWVQRELNGTADALSKPWEALYELKVEERQKVREWADGLAQGMNLPITNPHFNEIGNALNAAAANRQDLLLIHPVWHGQSWWSVLQTANGRVSREIGGATEVLVRTEANAGVVRVPDWRIRASILSWR